VIALFRVPFPLPEIVDDQLKVCWRAATAQGIARSSWNTDVEEADGLVLTARKSRTLCLRPAPDERFEKEKVDERMAGTRILDFLTTKRDLTGIRRKSPQLEHEKSMLVMAPAGGKA
jgi:hypothetical protein